MKMVIILTIISVFLLSCGGSITNSEVTETIVAFTETKLPATTTPISPTSTILVETKTPTATSTPTPIVDSEGNITWHPQQVLIQKKQGGGDGVAYDYPPNFLLLWDGTLFQRGNTYTDMPYISFLNQEEICKILNTVNSSGFFEEIPDYQFPFDGLGRETISVNSWNSNSSGGQILSHAISGATYYDSLFCRNCPIPSPNTIIKPGLANTYFFLENYYSPNRQKAQLDRISVYMNFTDETATHTWPFETITIDDFVQQCDESYCYDAGLVFNEDIAKEFFEKGDSSKIFEATYSGGIITFSLRFRPVWPYEPYYDYSTQKLSVWKEMPENYTITCNLSMGEYPILSLNPENQFWYYSPDGKWGAEVISSPNQYEQVRVVSTFGYEKYYEYDPALFGQTKIKVYPRYWTEDGKYFFTNILPADYNFQKTPFVNSLGLQRISIEDGKVSYVFIGTEGQSFGYSLSEQHRQIAYIRQGDFPLKITMKDSYTLQEKTATLTLLNSNIQYTEAGTIFWSIDGKFLFVAANYKADENIHTVVIKINTSNPAIQSIIYQDDKALKLVSDFGPYKARLCPLTEDIESYCSLYLNLETGTVG